MSSKLSVSFFLVLALVCSSLAQAQRIGTLINALGTGKSAEWGTITFFTDTAEEVLCLSVTSRTDPPQFNPRAVRVRVEYGTGEKAGKRSKALKFALKGRGEKLDSGRLAWTHCIVRPAVSADDLLDVEVLPLQRQQQLAGAGNPGLVNRISLPLPGISYGAEVRRTGTSVMTWVPTEDRSFTIDLNQLEGVMSGK